MKIWPRVYTFTPRCPLDLHTKSSKYTHISHVTPTSLGLRNPKQLAVHLGLISCPGEQKQAPPWPTMASVLHYHHHLPFSTAALPCKHPPSHPLPAVPPKPQQRGPSISVFPMKNCHWDCVRLRQLSDAESASGNEQGCRYKAGVRQKQGDVESE